MSYSYYQVGDLVSHSKVWTGQCKLGKVREITEAADGTAIIWVQWVKDWGQEYSGMFNFPYCESDLKEFKLLSDMNS